MTSPLDVAAIRAALDASERAREALQADVDRLRARTHEIQERADKRLADETRHLRNAKEWLDAMRANDKWARAELADRTGDESIRGWAVGMNTTLSRNIGYIITERDTLKLAVLALLESAGDTPEHVREQARAALRMCYEPRVAADVGDDHE